MKNAQLNLERYTQLAKSDSVARQQLDNQQAAVDQLNAQIKSDQAAIENAKTELSYTSLAAPFDGVTGIRLLHLGPTVGLDVLEPWERAALERNPNSKTF